MVILERYIDFITKAQQDRIESAKEFAKKIHSGVYRKGTDENGNKVPYINHPLSVAEIIKEVKDSKEIADLIIAGWLHDTVQDSPNREETKKEILEQFGELVYNIVMELTSDKEEIKKLGKAEYLTKKMLNMSSWALVIKLCDRYDNIKDLQLRFKEGERSRTWCIRYARETVKILVELEEKRSLSRTQKKIILMIKEKIKPIIDEIREN